MDIRICQITSTVPPTKDAVGIGAIKLQNLLRKRDLEVDTVTSASEQKDDNIYPLVKKWNLGGLVSILNFIQGRNYDAVLLHFPTTYYGRSIFVAFIPMLLRLFGKKVFVYLHEYQHRTILGKLRIQPILVFSNSIITTDQPNLKDLKNNVFAKNKSVMIPCASPLPEEILTKRISVDKEDIEQGKLSLTYFGFIRRGKGLSNLINILNQDEDLKNKVIMHIIGDLPVNPTDTDVEFKRKLSELNNVVFHGFVPEEKLPEVFAKVGFVFLPYENGLTERRGSFLAAAAFSKVILTIKPMNPIKGLVHEKNVIFIDDLSVKEVTNGINKLRGLDDAKQRDMGEEIHKWYIGNFSDKTVIDTFLLYLKSALEKNV